MPIKFKCPNPDCQKLLNVKDELAGQKRACPACKKVLTIPAVPTPAVARAPSTAETVTVARPADAEDLAASLLADEATPAEVEPPRTTRFTCEYCDEVVEVDAELIGKQAPCPNPECRRIIKVPKPAGHKGDWRSAGSDRPIGARRDTEPAPEGVWSTTERTYVSGEALEEADALPVRRAPTPPRVWVYRGLATVAVAGLLVAGTMFILDWLAGKRQAKLLNRALVAVSPNEGVLKGADGAAVHFAAGLYYLRSNETDSIAPEKGDAGARNQFALARGRLALAASQNPEADALLMELALAQIDLRGDEAQVNDGKRLTWSDTSKEVGQTLRAIVRPEARAEALRRAARKLIEAGQGNLAEDLAREVNGPTAYAVVGLEYLRAGDDALTRKLLDQVLTQWSTIKPKKDAKKAPPPPLTEALVTFLVAQGKGKEIPEVKQSDLKDLVEVGRIAGKAWSGQIEAARAEALKLKFVVLRFQALVAVAGARGDESAIRATAEAAVALAEAGLDRQPAPPWSVVRLVGIGQKVGIDGERLKALAERLGNADRGLRGWVQLQVVRDQLTQTAGPADEALVNGVDTNTLSQGLARVELARHNTRKGADMETAVEGWADNLKPYGLAGIALGLQEGS
jgi:signal transduction histidine kinase